MWCYETLVLSVCSQFQIYLERHSFVLSTISDLNQSHTVVMVDMKLVIQEHTLTNTAILRNLIVIHCYE